MLTALVGGPALALNNRIVHDIYTGIAIGGIDPMSYVVGGGPRPGSELYEAEYDGVYWRFGNEGNRAAFLDAPEIYAPAYGGHCAAAAAAGEIAIGDTGIWALVGWRLFLFSSRERRDAFLADAEAMIAAADTHWPALAETLSR